MISIGKIIKAYFLKYRVILYYYCDTTSAGLIISPKNQHNSPQEYRSKLFEKLFDYIARETYLKKTIIIDEQSNNDSHFITLISRKEDEIYITEISNEIQNMNNK